MSNPCFFIDMSKKFYFVFAFILIVAMLAPIQSKAATITINDLQIQNRDGVPVVTGTSLGYVSDYQAGLVSNSYEVRVPVTFSISNIEAGSYLSGYFPFNLQTNFNFYGDGEYFIQISNMESDCDGVRFVLGNRTKSYYNGSFNSSSSYKNTDDDIYIYIDNGMYSKSTRLRVTCYITYDVTLTGFADTANHPYYNTLTSASSVSSFFSEGPTLSVDYYPRGYSWLNSHLVKLTDQLKSNYESLSSDLQNWFQTQWTFGRQWTDDIIDAIVGQSGGGSIGTAQDELDNQLNSIENVEQQLSDQVLDKVDVPSISLSSDETGGLNWVVSTINSFYVAFDELHVMFACVVFFSICAVLLFGRRNL